MKNNHIDKTDITYCQSCNKNLSNNEICYYLKILKIIVCFKCSENYEEDKLLRIYVKL
jgi:hypothetical protein